MGASRRSFYDRWTRLVAGVLGTVAPAAAGRWSISRAALSHYQAATRTGSNGHRHPSGGSADSLISKDLKSVVARSRDLARNNTRINGAIRNIVAQVVYNGFTPQVQFQMDGVKDTERNQRFEGQWVRWARAVGWWEIEKLALRHSWMDGNLFIRVFPDPTLLRRNVCPLGVEAYEIDHLDTSVHGRLSNGRQAIRGIEYDPYGHVSAYYLYPEHPGGVGFGLLQDSVRIPASEIIHCYDRERASQTRGMSWLAPLVMDVYELDDYEAAVRIVARLQACMGFFIKTENSDQYLSQYTGLGTGQTDVPSGFATASEYGEIPESIDPASVHVLPPGMDAKALTSSQPGPDYEAYVRANLQGQSAGLGVSYQTYSNDYAQSTYSSARNGSLNERRGFRMQQLYLLEKLHGPIWERWCQYLSISGLIPGERDADVPVSWLLPGWPWVDPRNDAAAAKIKICELRTTSRQRAAGDQGDNWHEIATEQEEEERVLKDKGLTTEEKTDASQA